MAMWPDLIIGGIGGSGTRGITTALQEVGLLVSNTKTQAEDDIFSWATQNKYTTKLLDIAGGVFSPMGYKRNETLWNHASESLKMTAMASGLSIVAQNYELAGQKVKWGTKNPASFLLMPLYDEITSNHSRYLFVLRDPRDLRSAKVQANFEVFGSHMIASKNLTDYWGYWSGLMSDLLQHYEDDPRFKMVRIEDLVVPDPNQELTSYHVLDCITAHAGLSRPAAASALKALTESHKHSESYTGEHNGRTKEGQAKMADDLWVRAQQDPKVESIMKRIGYDPQTHALLKPLSSSVCTSDYRQP